MEYYSTRGGVEDLTFEEALLSGYLSDGGLCLPKYIPKITEEILKEWARLDYKTLVKEIVKLYVPESELSTVKASELIDKAFSKFDISDIVKIANLKSDLNILELFHGPTLAFKDLALSCVGQFLEYFLEKRKKHITILVATSGDTGSAAIEGVRGLKWVDLIVMLPRGRTSKIQELQMTTVIEDNIHVYRVDGTSDDLDAPIKDVFRDPALCRKHNLCSLNSINWGRIMIQIAHHFYAYFQMNPECNGEVEIVVPTGACGNVTAGIIAKCMGLPVKFVCAVNVNDIVCRTIENGDFSTSSSVTPTLAQAMDIQVPYNVERILHLYSEGNTNLVKIFQEQVEENGKSTVPTDLHEKIKEDMKSYVVDDEGIKMSMKRCWEENHYLLCPHTATAANYHYTHRGSEIKRVCLATASPAKFDEAVLAAGLSPQPTKQVQALFSKPTKYIDMERDEDWSANLRRALENIYNNTNNSN